MTGVWWRSVGAACVGYGWVSGWLYDITEIFFLFANEVRADDKRTGRLGLALHHLPQYISPLCVFALTFNSHAALVWFLRLRHTNEDVSLLLKTMVATKTTSSLPSPLLPARPRPPPQQMDWGESQAVFFKSISALVLCVHMWNGKVFLQNWHP